jgi:hypothetical protein
MMLISATSMIAIVSARMELQTKPIMVAKAAQENRIRLGIAHLALLGVVPSLFSNSHLPVEQMLMQGWIGVATPASCAAVRLPLMPA